MFRQLVNRISNNMAKGPFYLEVVILAKWQKWRFIAKLLTTYQMRCQRIPFGTFAILAKMAEMAINRQIVNDISNKMAKGSFYLEVVILAKWQKWRFIAKLLTTYQMRCQRIPFGTFAILAKMAEMAINRQIVNDISNKMAKGPVLKVAILAKMAETANNRQIVNNIIVKMANSAPFESGDFGENDRNGEQSSNC